MYWKPSLTWMVYNCWKRGGTTLNVPSAAQLGESLRASKSLWVEKIRVRCRSGPESLSKNKSLVLRCWYPSGSWRSRRFWGITGTLVVACRFRRIFRTIFEMETDAATASLTCCSSSAMIRRLGSCLDIACSFIALASFTRLTSVGSPAWLWTSNTYIKLSWLLILAECGWESVG